MSLSRNQGKVVVPLDQIERAYQDAIERATARFPAGMQREVAIDRVTDAVYRAAQTFDSAKCESFERYAYHCSWRSLRHASAMNHHQVGSIQEDQIPAASASRGESVDWTILPEPLRAVCLFHIDFGFNLRQTSILCGLTRQGVKKRLTAAAEILNLK